MLLLRIWLAWVALSLRTAASLAETAERALAETEHGQDSHETAEAVDRALRRQTREETA